MKARLDTGKRRCDDDSCQKKIEPVPEKRERTIEENNEEGQDIMVSHASRLDVIRQRERPCNFERRAFSKTEPAGGDGRGLPSPSERTTEPFNGEPHNLLQ